MSVRPEFGPTLPQMLSARGVSRRAMAAGLALLLAVVVAVVLAAPSISRNEHLVVDGPPQFNVVFPKDALHRVAPRPGELLRLAGSRRHVRATIAFRRVTFPADPGRDLIGGYLPVFAERREAQLRARYGPIQIVDEGKARVNRNPGYQIGFSAGRLLGRDIYLLPNEEGAREGILVALRQVRTGPIGAAAKAWVKQVRQAARSLDFGTSQDATS